MRLSLYIIGLGAAVGLWASVWSLGNAPAFDLVSYYTNAGAIESETLDSGLTAGDCAFALDSAPPRPLHSPEILLTCERR